MFDTLRGGPGGYWRIGPYREVQSMPTQLGGTAPKGSAATGTDPGAAVKCGSTPESSAAKRYKSTGASY